MLRRTLLSVFAMTVAMGCPPKEGGTSSTSAPSQSDVEGISHFVSSKPPAANDQCAELPEGPDSPMRKLAVMVRRLACEPALYYLPVDEIRKELGPPKGWTLEFGGPAAVSIRVPDRPKASVLAKAMGIQSPVALRSSKGAWASRIWHLGSNPNTGAFDLWGPGKVLIGVAVDYGSLDREVKVTPLKDEKLRASVSVSMPPSVVAVKDDAVAVKMLVAGLEQLAKDRSLLSRDPAEVAKAVGLDDERFRLSRRSIEGIQVAIDIWPKRTRIAADAVIEALDLKGEISHRRARDSDDYLLYRGSHGKHPWQGLGLEPSFNKRDGGSGKGYEAYILDGISVR